MSFSDLGIGMGLTFGQGGVDPILAAFADGTDGFYFDFSKTDRLFQNLTGTPADDPGENIYLGLESHSWVGLTYAQEMAAQPELISNPGNPFTVTTGWALVGGTISVVSNKLRVTDTGGGSSASILISTTSGSWYTVEYSGYAGTSLSPRIKVGTTAGGLDLGYVIPSASSGRVSFQATGATTYVSIQAIAGTNGQYVELSGISTKKIPGNHALQATTSFQPKWQTGGLARFDGLDDNLTTTLTPSNTGMTLLAKAKLAATGGNRGVMGVNGADGVSRCFLAFDASGFAAGGVGSDSLSVIKGSVDRSGAYCVLGLTVDASTWRLYEQGVQTNTGAKNGSCNTTLGIPLGSLNANGTFGTFANIDLTHALAIKKALTAAQIAAITNKWSIS